MWGAEIIKSILPVAISLLFSFLVHPIVRAQTTETQVILLGTGTPYPDPLASGPATAVVVGKRVFLFDAGAGLMRQVNAARLPVSGPEAVFITHLHSDHTLGYPDLILTSWIMRRTSALQIYGPPGLQRMTRQLLILTHIIRFGGTDEELLEGVRKGGFNGPVIVGKDLGRY